LAKGWKGFFELKNESNQLLNEYANILSEISKLQLTLGDTLEELKKISRKLDNISTNQNNRINARTSTRERIENVSQRIRSIEKNYQF
jgi:uncharacterized coiled-coil DUF342 family protein